MHIESARSPLPSRIFMQLAGYTVACFAGSYLLALVLVQPVFGIDALGNPYALSQYPSDPKVLHALLFIQTIWALGTFCIPIFLVAKQLNEPFAQFTQMNRSGSLLFFISAPVLLLAVNPLLTFTVQLNENMQLPEALYWLENWMKGAEQSAAELTEAILYSEGTVMLVVKLLVIALIPGICEELLFRAGLQQLLLRKTNRVHLAVWVSAAIFSAIHFQFYGFLPRMLLGGVLGYLMVYSGSLWPGIIFHFMNNATAVVIGHFHLDKSNVALLSEDYSYPWYATVLSILITAATVVYWAKKKTSTNGTGLDQNIQHA